MQNVLGQMATVVKVKDIHRKNVLTIVNMCLMGKFPEIFDQYNQVKNASYHMKYAKEVKTYHYTEYNMVLDQSK